MNIFRQGGSIRDRFLYRIMYPATLQPPSSFATVFLSMPDLFANLTSNWTWNYSPLGIPS
jgi:hypothetical protein